MRFPTRVREQILRRAGGRCEICGATMPVSQIHHRRPRGMGGSKDTASGTAANGIAIHPRCHSTVESNRELALTKGWLLLQGADPAATPVKLWDGYYLLAEDGTLTPLSPGSRIGRAVSAGTSSTASPSAPRDVEPSAPDSHGYTQ